MWLQERMGSLQQVCRRGCGFYNACIVPPLTHLGQGLNALPSHFAEHVATPVLTEWDTVVVQAMGVRAALKLTASHALVILASTFRMMQIAHTFLASYVGDEPAVAFLVVWPLLTTYLAGSLLGLVPWAGMRALGAVRTVLNWCKALVDFVVWLLI